MAFLVAWRPALGEGIRSDHGHPLSADLEREFFHVHVGPRRNTHRRSSSALLAGDLDLEPRQPGEVHQRPPEAVEH
jgi:hypothetical protein